MSCRSTSAGSALTTIARLESGLPDVQTLSAFHVLRADGRNHAAPTEAEWRQFLEEQHDLVRNNSTITEARRASLLRRLGAAAEERPDGASFHALANIRSATHRQVAAMDEQFTQMAAGLGGNEEEIAAAAGRLRQRFYEIEGTVDRSRSAAAPEGYSDDAARAARASNLPVDRGSVHAMNVLRQEVRRQRADRVLNGPQRIERQEMSSATIATAGYDAEDGRLEVTFRRSDGESRVYAYRNVPAETWAAMQTGSAGQVYNEQIRNNRDYRYADQTEADLASAARQCGDCGQFASNSHSCPVRIQREQEAAAAEAAAEAAREVERQAALAATNTEPPRPDPRTYYGGTRSVYARIDGETYGYVRMPRDTAIRRDSGVTPVNATLRYDSGYSRTGPRHQATLGITYDRPRRGVHTLAERTAQCSCPDYQANGDCVHVRTLREQANNLLPESQRPGAAPRERRRAVPVEERRTETRPTAQSTRYRYTSLGTGDSTPGAYRYHQDYVQSPANIAALRTEAGVGPVSFTSSAQTYRSDSHSEVQAGNLPSGRYMTSTVGVYDRPRRGVHTLTFRESQCNCPQYQQHGNCPHVRMHQNYLRAQMLPANQMPDASQLSEEERLEAERTAAWREEQERIAEEARIRRAQEEAEAARRSDFMNHEEMRAESQRRWAVAADDPNAYTNNFEAFESDYQAALARKAAGEDPIPYMRENALGGLCTPESGIGFGVEMEFDFPDTVNQGTALAAIGRDLHALGLTSSPQQQGYHASERAGYTTNHQGGWSYERDCTVAGEIVSPVMFDTPETWDNIEKVCEIVKRHGGRATVRTGSHVHVGTPNTTTQTATELVRMANQHEDVLYRVSSNPSSASHRPMRWCGPNADVSPNGYSDLYQVQRANNSHGLGVNLQSVNGRGSDHVEIRHWDGTLSPSVIQTQVKISAAMVAAAERNGTSGTIPVVREPRGAHATRLTAAGHDDRARHTGDVLREDSASARSFADTLFTRSEDRAQFAALFAVTNWTRSNDG